MDNWQEDALIGHTHEPNEITVQLDGLGRKLWDLPAAPAVQEVSDGPVFVDESGRRSKKFRRLGWVVVIACACYAVTLAVALIGGNSTAPLLPGFGQSEKEQTDKVEIQPAPSGSESATTSPGAIPGSPNPTDSTGAVVQPSGGPSSATTGTVGPTAPGVSSSFAPRPSGGIVPAPGGGPSVTSSPGGGGSDPGPGPDPSPSGPAPSDPGPSAPTDPPVQEGAL